jgi:hypothetical protein
LIGVEKSPTPYAKKPKTAKTFSTKSAEIFRSMGDDSSISFNDFDIDGCNISESILFLQKLALSPNASSINVAFINHITNALIFTIGLELVKALSDTSFEFQFYPYKQPTDSANYISMPPISCVKHPTKQRKKTSRHIVTDLLPWNPSTGPAAAASTSTALVLPTASCPSCPPATTPEAHQHAGGANPLNSTRKCYPHRIPCPID